MGPECKLGGVKRLVLTVGRGKPKYAEMALGLGRSLSLIGDPEPRAVVSDLSGFPWEPHFQQVLPAPGKRSALDKLLGLELTDADAILSIDADCLAFRRLGPIFDYCKGKGFAIVGHFQSEGTWHGADVAAVCRDLGVPKIPSFNGGLIYYERTPQTLELIQEMKRIEREFDQTGFERFRGGASEEVCVLLAMAKTGYGEVVPDETDFMNTGVGLIEKLRLDVMNNDCRFVCRRHAVRFARPYVFHASRYSNFSIYWRELDRLAWLDRYGQKRPHGYMSPFFKLRRSFERRYLKYVLRKL
jgi:hypothetical protein